MQIVSCEEYWCFINTEGTIVDLEFPHLIYFLSVYLINYMKHLQVILYCGI